MHGVPGKLFRPENYENISLHKLAYELSLYIGRENTFLASFNDDYRNKSDVARYTTKFGIYGRMGEMTTPNTNERKLNCCFFFLIHLHNNNRYGDGVRVVLGSGHVCSVFGKSPHPI